MREEPKVMDRLGEELKSLLNELRPLLLSILFLILGILILLAVKFWINDQGARTGDAVLVALLVMPILVFTIISGRLQELKGPGGMEIRLNQIATAPVTGTISHDPIPVDEAQFLTKDEGKLEEKLKGIEEDQPIILKLTFGKIHAETFRYSVADLRRYVKRLSSYRSFKLVALVDDKDGFVACMSPWTAESLLNRPEQAEKLTNAINDADKELLEYPGIVHQTVSTKSTNAEALRVMTDNNLEAVVVTDRKNRLNGIAERGQVLSEMVLALTPDS